MITDLNFLNKYGLDSYYNGTRISPDFFRKLAFIECHSSSMFVMCVLGNHKIINGLSVFEMLRIDKNKVNRTDENKVT